MYSNCNLTGEMGSISPSFAGKLVRPYKNKNPPASPRDQFVMRRKRDSNPRNRGYSSTVFKTAAFDRSAISPDQSLFVLQYSIPHNHPAEAGKFLHSQFIRRKDKIFLIF